MTQFYQEQAAKIIKNLNYLQAGPQLKDKLVKVSTQILKRTKLAQESLMQYNEGKACKNEAQMPTQPNQRRF